MLNVHIKELEHIKEFEKESDKNYLLMQGVNTDLNTIKQDLKDLKEIYVNLDKYVNEKNLKYFEWDQFNYNYSISVYKEAIYISNNGKLTYITKEHVKYSKLCRKYLNKIVREIKKRLDSQNKTNEK